MFQADGKRFVLFTYLTIGYDTVSLSTATKFNSSLNTVNTSKQTKKMVRKPSTLFRIIACSPQNGKVRPLTSLYKLLPDDDTEEVVSTDTRTHQFEIAF